jgi:hypothetical protein
MLKNIREGGTMTNPIQAKRVMQAPDKELYEACMKQAEYFSDRWDKRRDYEWKFSVSLWTLLAAGSAVLAGKGQVPWWIFLIPGGLHAWWLHGVWAANDFDKTMARNFRDQAQVLLAGEIATIPDFPKKRKAYEMLFDWSMRFQLICTLLLGLVLVFVNRMSILQPAQQQPPIQQHDSGVPQARPQGKAEQQPQPKH